MTVGTGTTDTTTTSVGTGAVPAERVVVLRALGLGDLLTAVPALRGLRRARPHAHVTLAAPAWLAPLVPLLGAVDRLVDVAPLGPLPAVAHGCDLAVNLHGRGPQSTARLREAAPRELWAYGTTSTWRDEEHEVRRWCRLLDEAGVPCDPDDLDLARPAEPPRVGGAVLLHPGSAAASRRWPVERWAEVARRVPGRVVVSAGPGERDRAEAVATAAGLAPSAVVADLSLTALVALVAASRLVLAPDTGVAHLATALGTPSVVLFGPVPPSLWGPPPGRARHVALGGLQRSDNASLEPAPALLAVTPDEVVRAAEALLARG